MQNEKAYMSSNALEHVPPVPPVPAWPPPWLASPNEQAEAAPKPEPIPPLRPFVAPSDDLPELAAWDDVTVEECGDPCPKCGSLEKWWDFDNKPHCQQCQPIRRAMALADLAARIRSRKR